MAGYGLDFVRRTSDIGQVRSGGVSVSEMHANFIVADEHATAQDVWNLVWAVRRRVGESAGSWLVPEIQFAGPFESTGDELTGLEAAG